MKLRLSLSLLLVACTHEPPPAPSVATEIPTPSAPIISASGAPSSAPSSSSAIIAGHTVTLSPKGFTRSCADRPIVSVTNDDGGIRVADQSLPGKGNYYLDGKYAGYMMCDLVVCNAATDVPVDLIEYEKTGTRPPPGGQGAAPVYRTVDLKGKVTVTLHYFSDDKCSVPKTLTQTVVR